VETAALLIDAVSTIDHLAAKAESVEASAILQLFARTPT
jgi:hypothetical protein